eukprot:531042_1
MTINDLETKCEPFKRIEMVLNAYNQLMDTTRQVEIFDIIQNKGKYDHQQLFDDFMHVKIIHIDGNNDTIRSHDNWQRIQGNELNENGYIGIGQEICNYFQNQFPCHSIIQCHAAKRHYRQRQCEVLSTRRRLTESFMEQKYCTEDVSFRDLCDTIH